MKTQTNTMDGARLSKLGSGAFQGHFGGCPDCGDAEGPYNVGRAHWLVCPEHCVRWLIGENLFRAWRDESPEEWEATQRWLDGFRVVKPVYGDDTNPDGEADNDDR